MNQCYQISQSSQNRKHGGFFSTSSTSSLVSNEIDNQSYNHGFYNEDCYAKYQIRLNFSTTIVEIIPYDIKEGRLMINLCRLSHFTGLETQWTILLLLLTLTDKAKNYHSNWRFNKASLQIKPFSRAKIKISMLPICTV